MDKRYSIFPIQHADLWERYQHSKEQHWDVNEVDLSDDKWDHLTDIEKNVMKTILAFFLVSDGMVIDNLVYKVLPEIEEEEAQFFYNFQVFNECFDKETEVLTKEGFKFLKDITFQDRVAQYTLNKGDITYSKPSKLIKKPYKGVMHHYKGKYQDLMVTPKHDLITVNYESKIEKKSKSEDGQWLQTGSVVSGYKREGRSKLTTLEKILIAIQADGTVLGNTPSGIECGRRDVSISVYKERKIKRLKELLKDWDYPYKIVKSQRNGFKVGFRLPNHISNQSVKTFGWIETSEISSDWGKEFLFELSKWDSTIRKNSFVYYNTNSCAIDKVQEIGVLSGFYTYKTLNRTSEQSSKIKRPGGSLPKETKDCYYVSLKEKHLTRYSPKKEVEYDDYVYCATMPEGTLVTRRGGYVSIQGNCIHAEQYGLFIESYIQDPLEKNFLYKPIENLATVRKKANWALDWIESDKSTLAHKLISFAVVEGLFFSSLFATVFYFRQGGKLPGLCQGNELIMRDENSHYEFAIHYYLNHCKVKLSDEELKEIILSAYEVEKTFVEELLIHGLPGLTKELMLQFVQFTTDTILIDLGLEKNFNVNQPLDFMKKIALKTRSNFFERKSGEYTKLQQSNTLFDDDF